MQEQEGPGDSRQLRESLSNVLRGGFIREVVPNYPFCSALNGETQSSSATEYFHAIVKDVLIFIVMILV